MVCDAWGRMYAAAAVFRDAVFDDDNFMDYRSFDTPLETKYEHHFIVVPQVPEND